MKKILIVSLLTVTAGLYAQKPVEMLLWPDGAPNSNGLEGKEVQLENGRVANIHEPAVTVFKSAVPNSIAVVMCPGGGYVRLAMNHEGLDMAPWFHAQNITYVVLKYRMPNGNYDVPLSDAEQAIRLVRRHADEWNVDPDRVGVMGASAGGHLASTLATHYSSRETRPDFQVLLYPVITMDPGYTHAGSRENLLGKSPSAELERKFSNELQVTSETPKAFITLSSDDGAVAPSNGVNYYLALLRNNVRAALHAYPVGGHGWGFRDNFPYKRQWTEELEKWLREELREDNLMLKHGLALLGTPYVAHTLERTAKEELFTGRSELDCTTFVETVLAMSLCTGENKTLTEKEFAAQLQKIRYRGGVIDGYASRLHYATDWINDNIRKGIIADITAVHSQDTDTVRLSFMSGHPDKYKHLRSDPENLTRIREIEKSLTGQRIHRIPKQDLPDEGFPWIKDGDIIMLTTLIDGLDVSHTGIAIRRNGMLHLLHASSVEKKVVIDQRTLREQLAQSKHVTGIRVVRLVKSAALFTSPQG
jgi:acetyl esterase/lipase